MKRVAVFLVLAAIFFACAPARAQQNSDEQYLIIYGLIQQADGQADSGDRVHALDSYKQAQVQLDSFNRMYPDWNPRIIDYRTTYVAAKIAELTSVQPATNAAPATVASPASATNNSDLTATNAALAAANTALQTQLQSTQQQLQGAQANNATLSAKLKEALAIQPAAVDAHELEKAREQVRDLMKQNDLLQATINQHNQQKPAEASTADAAMLANIQKELADAKEKLREESIRADRFELENQSLSDRIKQLMSSPEATAALVQENTLLKKQLADLRATSTVTPASAPATTPVAVPSADTGAELAQAHNTISLLQSNVMVTAMERDALQQRVKQLQSGATNGLGVQQQADYEAKIKTLTDERNDLLGKLGAANQTIYGHKKQDVAAKVQQLTDEVTTLRARLAMDEAQVVPYTPEELALFKQPAPLMANPNAEKKSIKELPAGSAELVAEAQSFFAAKKFDEAEQDYLKILDRDQNNGLILANLATIELQQNKLDDAEKHIRTALSQSPNDAYSVAVLGYVQFQQGKYDDAADSLSRAAKLDPQNPQILNHLAGCYSHKGLRQQAETALRKAIQLDPNNPEAHNNLAVIYLSENPPLVQLARWHYQKALDGGLPHNQDLEKELADKGAPIN